MDQVTSKLLKENTSEEELFWVIQKGLPETTINEWKEDDVRTRKPINYSSPQFEGPNSK
jgi:hypothetical protein